MNDSGRGRCVGISVATADAEIYMAKKASARRELVSTGTDKRYGRRAEQGQFKESDDVGRAAVGDRRQPRGARGSKRARATADH